MGAHHSSDRDDPLCSTSEWWQSQHPPDNSPTQQFRPLGDPSRTRVMGRPPGLPTDRYGEERTTGVPLIRPVSPPINTGGMPTQDRPRTPQPVAAAHRPAPAEKPGFGVRILDFLSVWLIKTLALVLAAGLVAWAVGIDRTITSLRKQNQDLRQVQIDQHQRIAELEAKPSGR